MYSKTSSSNPFSDHLDELVYHMPTTDEVYNSSPIPGHEYMFRLSNLNSHERAWLIQEYPETFPEWIAQSEGKPTDYEVEE